MPAPSSQPATSSAGFPAEALKRLAGLILTGDVVFFIGAGFSIDSERNTGQRLIRRLLIRLEAMAHHLGPDARAIRDSLRSTFDLSKTSRSADTPLFPYTDDGQTNCDINKLANRYFEANDWFCRAFAELLRIASREIPSANRAPCLAQIHADEEIIRLHPKARRNDDGTLQENEPSPWPIDEVPLDNRTLSSLMDWVADTQPKPGAPPSLQDAKLSAGKALFLDTMGFRDARVMAGEPTVDSPASLSESYGNRLLPRHHFLARLARDGLCTTTVTTNFDLLLEGSFRLAGFAHRVAVPTDTMPPTHFAAYAPVTSPVQFFDEGKAHRTAVLVKMHGCAGSYRSLELTPSNAPKVRPYLRHYLRSMVFTYREIQNWREDAWAADFLRTLLRTRTVVFAGYSLQDPVVHDTFRTVYEEMARIRRSDAGVASVLTEARALFSSGNPPSFAEPAPEKAPAFFMDVMDPEYPDKTPFHALEVLNAASDAVGAPHGPFGNHPNIIRFHRRNRPEFPNLDEICRWLFHLVLRLRQRECLRNELQRTLTALHGRSRPEVELRTVRRAFRLLVEVERGAAGRWNSRTPEAVAVSRQQLSRVGSWSDSFHIGLLREFAAVDQLRRQGGLGMRLQSLRRHGWYYPFMQDAGWTCWGAVVELALRRMIRSYQRSLNTPPAPIHLPGAERVWAAASELPTALYLRPSVPTRAPSDPLNPSIPVLQALSIRFDGFDPTETVSALHGHPTQTCIWLLRDGDAPWRPSPRSQPDAHPPHDTPPASDDDLELPGPATRQSRSIVERRPPPTSVIWRWASRTETQRDRENAPAWLGLTPL